MAGALLMFGAGSVSALHVRPLAWQIALADLKSIICMLKELARDSAVGESILDDLTKQCRVVISALRGHGITVPI